ncbi:putative manganese/zinc-exporting P-type ATPase [bioreactor metagenome]|uniref:Putative manganese/zinc-exporting P-type ATPase n=1 Tax=bioreactor metagenome TaxID=1076179 RepID=A0A645FVT9_9ZZZZ
MEAEIGGQQVLAGSESLLKERGILLPPALEEAARDARADGSTVIFVARGGSASGLLVLADTIRTDAAETVESILKTGAKTVLLTGDAPQAAAHIARAAGIRDVRAGCLPERKLEVIRALQERGERVCMVGDGINDAPALKAAHVGIAMGGVGSDIAIDAADIVLVGDDIRQLPHLLRLAKRTMTTIHMNLAASMLLNFLAIGLAISGRLSPVLGALVHNAGSVAVILHSALLLGWRKD